MLGALSAVSLTLGLGGAPAPFTAQYGNGGLAKAVPLSNSSSNNCIQLLIKSSFASTSKTTPSFTTAIIHFQLSPDKIIVLENGKVIEQGPHDFLLAKAGRYAQLWAQQNNSMGAIDIAIKLEA